MGINLRAVMTNMTIFRCKVFELVVILTTSFAASCGFIRRNRGQGGRKGGGNAEERQKC